MGIGSRLLAWWLAAIVVLAAAGGAHAALQAPVTVPTPGGEVSVVADHLEEVGPDKLLVATGNVEITRGTARLTADRVEINRDTGESVATGRVIFYEGEDRFSADRIDYNFRTGTGVVYEPQGHAAPYYRLSGERMERLAESVYRVRRGIFTTCEADPPAWSVHFGSGTADLNEFFYGTNASFWVRNVPLIPWIPFFAAAIRRERQTGFLFPRAGLLSSKGVSMELPFFWAISDSQDLTLGLLGYEKRGAGLDADYRYVLSQHHHGWFKGFFLEESQRNGADRGWAAILHDWRLSPDLRFTADVKGVTDDTVLREYGDAIHQRSEQRVRSNVFLTRNWPTWSLVGDLFWYQDLTTRRPIELDRLPDILLQGVRQPLPGLPGTLYEMDAGLVRFVRDVGSEGTRLDLHPRLSQPLSAGGLFTVTPFAGGRLTAYDRRVTETHVSRSSGLIEDTTEDFRVRRLVEAGTDVSATASRAYQPSGWLGFDAFLHTIEPRLGYTRIAGQDLNRLPSWTDVDRIEDTSRLEYSLTNRLRGRTVESGGEVQRLEVVRFLVGHSLDLKSNHPLSGDVVGDLIFQPRQSIHFRGDLRLDTRGDGVQTSNTEASVTIERVTGSVGTRYDKPGKITFLQASVSAEATRNVTGRVTTNWDLRTNTFVESRFLAELKFQCYSLSVEYVQRSHEAGRRGEDAVIVALNLLGIGGTASRSIGLGSITSSGGISSR